MTVQDDLLSFRRNQVGEDYHLLPMPSGLIQSAEHRQVEIRNELIENPDKYDDLMYEGQNVGQALKDIRRIRSWLIFELAWSDQGIRDTMTADEWKAYEVLRDIGKGLRRE